MRRILSRLTRSRTVRQVLAALALIASIGFLAYSSYANWQELRWHRWTLNYGYLALAFLPYPLSLAVLIAVWYSMMRCIGVAASFSKHLRIYCYTNLARRLPGAALWYLGGRVYLYDREGVAHSVSALGSLLELTLHSLAGVLVFLALRPFYSGQGMLKSNWFLALLIPLGLVMVNPALMSAKVSQRLQKVNPGRVQDIALHRKGLLIWMGAYSFTWLCAGVVLYLLLEALHPGSTVDLATVTGIGALVGGVASVAAFVPIGLGREVTISLLLGRYVPLPVAIAVALLFRLLSIVAEVFWAIVFLLAAAIVSSKGSDHRP